MFLWQEVPIKVFRPAQFLDLAVRSLGAAASSDPDLVTVDFKIMDGDRVCFDYKFSDGSNVAARRCRVVDGGVVFAGGRGGGGQAVGDAAAPSRLPPDRHASPPRASAASLALAADAASDAAGATRGAPAAPALSAGLVEGSLYQLNGAPL